MRSINENKKGPTLEGIKYYMASTDTYAMNDHASALVHASSVLTNVWISVRRHFVAILGYFSNSTSMSYAVASSNDPLSFPSSSFYTKDCSNREKIGIDFFPFCLVYWVIKFCIRFLICSSRLSLVCVS